MRFLSEHTGFVFETDEPTLLSIIRGEQNANTAVLSGKVKVHGDLALALKIQQFLSSNLTGFVV